MASDGKVLSQPDVDKMMARALSQQETGRVVNSATAATNQPKPDTVPPASNAQAVLGNLAKRLDALESVMRNSQQGNATAAVSALASQVQKALQGLMEQNQRLEARVDELSEQLGATPASGIQKTFVCQSCGASGLVATRVACTQCGGELWWGWYPKGK